MGEIIDLTISPQREVIEISSDHGNSPSRHDRTQGDKKRKRKKGGGKISNGLSSDGISSSAQPSRAHSPEIARKSSEVDRSTPQTERAASNTRRIADEPGLFFVDIAAAPVATDDTAPSEPVGSNEDGNKLLLPSHVVVLRDNGSTPAQLIPPPKPSSDDEECIEYLEYEDHKALGLIRYFDVQEESNQSGRSIFKCKNCGSEGDHKTYECPVQICLTCGARDEHATRSCPNSKTCYTCGMKGHINKTCPNRYSVSAVTSELHGGCDRCGSTEHNTNECSTLWRIYQYVNKEERILIMQSREQKKGLAIGEGGEGYVGGEMWCYNCARMGHLGDDCDELAHSATFPRECSAFSGRNMMSGPFYDPAAAERESGVSRYHLEDDWDAGAPVDVGKRGRNKDKERLEKRFREQEDEGADWFEEVRNVGKTQARTAASRGRPGGLRIGSLKGGGHEPSSPPGNVGGLSLLERLGDARGGGQRQDKPTIHVRGAAGRETHRAERRGHRRPLYRGGYDR